MEGLEFTTEVVGDFPAEWGLPTLDCAWKMVGGLVGEERRSVGYKHFKKLMSSKWVTPHRSAQGMNGKIATLSQDVFRLLSNSNWAVSKEEKV